MLSRWIYSGESSCKLYRGCVSFCLLSKHVINLSHHMHSVWNVWLLFCASSQACADPEALTSCRDWLKGPVLGGQLLGLTEELCRFGRSCPTSASSTSNHSWTLISLVLSQHHNNGENICQQTFMLFKKNPFQWLKYIIIYLICFFFLAQSL